ncbi:ATP-dependent Clp protease proteolytic subunit [Streptomyces pluripotens]|uniref:ATP-dependent Clp protease proteolytic subunit n=1 Tax=Streptomyces pluripotens TaxID=1355015 RepID=A0A221NTK4_9ACTN|nr:MULTISPECIES: ATP-dependent Clp protease proteolytic subunit [Streptomyces]ARP68984.1 ATP-dependent Clp protease proteolytic subunit [Streptomyces pluripotens]ASN23242.1 ATP-dependent Clp protease proteolytic subunit [Streptomyces pluripotens]MCH0556980.1 ATP-dependent Clp protease proteolytic subunit [Streptomyces sp. MUM 16J]
MSRPSARRALPEFTERTQAGTRALDPYGKLFQERVVFLGTPLDDTAANDVAAQFVYLEHASPDRDITLYINSPGGTFSAMATVYDTMRYVGCDVATYCLGQAASVAAVLLAAGTPGKRFTLPSARMVLEQPALPEPVHGSPSDLAIQAWELDRTRTLLENMLVEHTGRTPEQVGRDVQRDLALDAPRALAYGLVDGIVPGRRQLPDAPREK